MILVVKTSLGSYYFSVDILDKNENVIYRSDITPQTIIYSEDQKGAYNDDITGGLNIPQYDVTAGQYPIPTNRSH